MTQPVLFDTPTPPPSGALQTTFGPDGPPIGTVLRFRIKHTAGLYDYAALRAGDGLWYTTGATSAQGVTWPAFAAAVRTRLAGPLALMTDRTHYYL